MTWTTGRRSTDYYKLKLFSFWRFDCYLIKYDQSFQLDLHIDEVPGFQHHRCNIQIYGERAMYFLEPPYFTSAKHRVNIFRADKPHGLYFTSRRGLMLSFGWIKKVTE